MTTDLELRNHVRGRLASFKAPDHIEFGLLPKTAGVLNDTVLVRSMAAWDTLHNFGQYYQQVGHAYSAARAAEMAACRCRTQSVR